MRKYENTRIAAIILFAVVGTVHALRAHAEDVDIYCLDQHSGDVDWSPDGKLIAYAKNDPKGDGYYAVWIVRPDGTGHKCLSRSWPGKKGFPHKHVGGVTWHSSGNYLAFVAQNNDAVGEFVDIHAKPGSGLNCNLWLMTSDGKEVWQLTHHKTHETAPRGVIHPQFSSDGKSLIWAEAIGKYAYKEDRVYQWGEWQIKIAEIKIRKKGPKLLNVRDFRPGAQKVFYETHDFSLNGKKALFCGNLKKGQPLNGIDIYELNTANGKAKRLTRTRTDWDEHAHYSPDGKLITWVSGAGFNVIFPTLRSPEWRQYVKLDMWAMNAKGSNRRRITFFNKEGHPDNEWFSKRVYDSPRHVVSDSDWSPDGGNMVATVAYEGPDKTLGSVLVVLDMEKRLNDK